MKMCLIRIRPCAITEVQRAGRLPQFQESGSPKTDSWVRCNS
uniref:Uncharacterized protein n=1 Tax=Anguilla anguilla TaxID=7936 RepID=A0A0E9UST7_ANGAN